MTSNAETNAKAKEGIIGFFNPSEPKNFTNNAKKSLPTQR